MLVSGQLPQFQMRDCGLGRLQLGLSWRSSEGWPDYKSILGTGLAVLTEGLNVAAEVRAREGLKMAPMYVCGLSTQMGRGATEWDAKGWGRKRKTAFGSPRQMKLPRERTRRGPGPGRLQVQRWVKRKETEQGRPARWGRTREGMG